MHDFLDEILLHKYSVVKKKKSYYETLKKKISTENFNRYNLFKNAISGDREIHLIAEVKKASPSKGLIRKDFNALGIAQIYADNGASALSILTEEKYFLGKPGYLTTISENVSLPLLVKDFIVDEGQIYEAYSLGASAVLLIVAILEDDKLKHLFDIASNMDLDCLVEIHNENELDRALDIGAEIIGINNRDLHTFDVDLEVSERLIPKITPEKIIVVESGISSHEEILFFHELGANAVLIGETFLREADVAGKVKEVMQGAS